MRQAHGGLFWSAVQLSLRLIQPFLQGFPWIWSQQPRLQEPKAQEQGSSLKSQSVLWKSQKPPQGCEHPKPIETWATTVLAGHLQLEKSLQWHWSGWNLATLPQLPPKRKIEASEGTEECEAAQQGDASSTTLYSPQARPVVTSTCQQTTAKLTCKILTAIAALHVGEWLQDTLLEQNLAFVNC